MKLLRFLPLLLLLCGCAREVSPVSALALDCKNGVYCLTAEVVRQDSPDDTAAPAYLSATGTDVTDALRNLRSILPGDLYLSHAQVLLLSEEAVSESILPLADYLCRETMCGSACGQRRAGRLCRRAAGERQRGVRAQRAA